MHKKIDRSSKVCWGITIYVRKFQHLSEFLLKLQMIHELLLCRGSLSWLSHLVIMYGETRKTAGNKGSCLLLLLSGHRFRSYSVLKKKLHASDLIFTNARIHTQSSEGIDQVKYPSADQCKLHHVMKRPVDPK